MHPRSSSYASGVYWQGRSDMLYYSALDKIIRTVGCDASSIIDVGSGNSPYLDWWTWIPHKVSVDIRHPYESPQVHGVVANILDYQVADRFDVATCFQVLEHVSDAKSFARRLFEIGKTVVISVPWMWPEGRTAGHVHDPVSAEKLKSWVGRDPNHSLVVSEPFGSVKHQRLIAVYHEDASKRFNSRSNRRSRGIGPVST